jgi:hypothetical protein
MLCSFTLKMVDITVNGQHIQEFTMSWEEHCSEEHLLELSMLFLTNRASFFQKMIGLDFVKRSSLEFERL